MKRVVTLILGIIIGIVLAVGGAAAAGLYVLQSKGAVGKINDAATKLSGSFPLKPDEEVRGMSLSEYTNKLFAMVKDISKVEIEQFEKLAGTDAVSKAISNIFGLEQEVIKPSTFGDLGKTLTASLTVRVMQDKFQVALPSMPVFTEEAFLDSPLKDAFSNLESRPLDRFITIVYDDNPDTQLRRSPKLLQSMGDTPLRDISSSFGEKLDNMTLGEIITINHEPGPEQSNKILRYLSDKQVKNLNQVLKDMKLSDAVNIDENSHAVLRAIANDSIDTLSDTPHMTSVINGIKLGEFITINSESEPILQALSDTPIGELGPRIETLTVVEIFREPDVGVLSLIPGNTTLQNIPSALTNAVSHSSLYTLEVSGVFEIDKPILVSRNVVYNSTVVDVVNNYSSGKLPIDAMQWIVLYDTTLPPWIAADPNFANPSYKYVDLALLEAAGYIERVTASIGGVSTAGVWKITQNTLNNLHGASDPAKYGTVFFPVGNINIIIEGNEGATENTFERPFSFHMAYLDAHSDTSRVLIGNHIRMVNDRGGYISYSAVLGHVYADASLSGDFNQLVVGVNEPTIVRKLIQRDSLSPEIPNILIEYEPA